MSWTRARIHEAGGFCACCNDPTFLKAFAADLANALQGWLSRKLWPEPALDESVCQPCVAPNAPILQSNRRWKLVPVKPDPSVGVDPRAGLSRIYWLAAGCGVLLASLVAWQIVPRR